MYALAYYPIKYSDLQKFAVFIKKKMVTVMRPITFFCPSFQENKS